MVSDETQVGLRPSSQIVLNFFPVEFSRNEIEVYVGKYPGDEQFQQLQERLKGCQAWRDTSDGTRIYVWKHDSDVEFTEPGFRKATVNLISDAPLFSKILIEGISRHLQANDFTRILGRVEDYTFTNFTSGNLLDSIPLLKSDASIGVFPKFTVQTFLTSFGETELLLGIIVWAEHRTKLDVSIADLIESGIDCSNLYVKFKAADNTSVELQEFDGLLIGCVERVQDDVVTLRDTRDPKVKQVDASCCFLEPNRRMLDFYLQNKYRTSYNSIRNQVQSAFNEFISPQSKLELIESFAENSLSGVQLSGDRPSLAIADQLRATFQRNYPLRDDSQQFRIDYLLEPSLSFDPESAKTDSSAARGLRQHGPYTSSILKDKEMKILVISPDIWKGHVQQFITQFENGVKGYERNYPGFQKEFHIKSLQIEERYFSLTGNAPKDDYYNFCIRLVEESTDWDLCFVVIKEDYKKLGNLNDPYTICKHLLLVHGIVSQDIRIESLRQPEDQLRWTLHNLALASYAKLGGIPYVLKTRQAQQQELIFGIGHSTAWPSRLSPVKNYIGFTTVFRSDGDYILNTCTPWVDFNNYQPHLEELIIDTVKEVAQIEGIKEGEPIRLIFHIYKRVGHKEVNAVNNAIGKLPQYQIEAALVHINDTHLFRIFDKLNPGKSNWKGQIDALTSYIPPRGLVVEIGPRERLINFIGPNQYKKHGAPMPLRITLDKSSDFKDVDYIAQQIYEFAFVSWRGFNPKNEPVTTFYSQLVANLNGRLREIPGWNEVVVKTRLGRKLWFI